MNRITLSTNKLINPLTSQPITEAVRPREPVQEVGHQVIDRAKAIQIRQHLRIALNVGAIGKVFRAVVNELLHAFPRGLQVELESGNAVSEGKGLCFASLASGKMDGAARDLEGVAVPVECRKPIWKEAGEIGLHGLRRLFNGVPANLDTGVACHLRTQYAGKKL